MYKIGIDIGSTAAKAVVMEENKILDYFVMPTGWSSIDTADKIFKILNEKGYNKENSKIVATGYGRISVPFADKTITEITCHGTGAYYFYKDDCTVIDIGGQDTKVITIQNGIVSDFTMNDKCSAGTGRFIEIMANTLGVSLDSLTELAKHGKDIKITSMCTVFAESEVISLIGRGEKREDIAFGIINSVVTRVVSLCQKHGKNNIFFLTGGLCSNEYILSLLKEQLGCEVITNPLGRYAGAVGAAIMAGKIKK